jgi:hypothetical protein
VTRFVLDDLMHALKADAAVPPARLKAERYLNTGLLIVDEVAFRPLDCHEANLFFRLVAPRYEKGSIVLTSNKHVRDWPEIFAGDKILTTAILDRLLHHVYVVHIDGRGYRLRALDGLLRPAAGPSPSLRKEKSRNPQDGGAQKYVFPDCAKLGVPLQTAARVGHPPLGSRLPAHVDRLWFALPEAGVRPSMGSVGDCYDQCDVRAAGRSPLPLAGVFRLRPTDESRGGPVGNRVPTFF